ncbi:MAG: nucleotidyltransferase domain-containing protein [Coriobacteriia bacterium]|nr:nucleotidyltransferase domain-containing protein [Coriobacteriia bacterium]
MRLPPYELNIIDKFATEQRVSKTDAFLHFLRKGIEANDDVGSQLEDIKLSLKKVLQSIPVTLTRKEIKTAAAHLAPDFPAIERAYLFGSFARGDATSASDIDLRLELSDKAPFSLFDLARFKKAFEKQTSRETDVITAKDLKNPRLQEAIKNEGILIYERTE